MKEKIIEFLHPFGWVCACVGMTLTAVQRENTFSLILLFIAVMSLLIYFGFNDEDIIHFAKVKPDAIIPSKRDEDGAMDIYACFDQDYIIIEPNEIKMIPTGIASVFNKKWRIVFQERGSTGIIGLKINAGLIDSGFRNEWVVILNNTSNKTIAIDKSINEKFEDDCSVCYPYTKAICQAKVQRVPEVKIKETTYDRIKKIKSERGLGMLGSSKK